MQENEIYTTGTNDISLLEVFVPINFSNKRTVSPICLPPPGKKRNQLGLEMLIRCPYTFSMGR